MSRILQGTESGRLSGYDQCSTIEKDKEYNQVNSLKAENEVLKRKVHEQNQELLDLYRRLAARGPF